MTTGERIVRELKWFFTALATSSLLSILYYIVYSTIETADGAGPEFTLRVYLVGWLTLFACLYVGRIMVRFLKVVMSADTPNEAP